MPQAGQDQRSVVPVTNGVKQNGQSVSAAGGIVFSILLRDGLKARKMRITRTIAAAGAATRQTQLPKANSGSGGTTQNMIEIATRQ